MKIAFVSTVLNFPLGGSDTLWSHAAEAALSRRQSLQINVSTAVASHPRIQALRAGGALVAAREPTQVPRGLPARLARKLGWSKTEDGHLTAAVRAFGPDLVIVSQGGTYDLVLYPEFSRWLVTSGVRYRLIANWQTAYPELTEPSRESMGRLFTGADAVCFVSTHNLEVTRRHLSRPLATGWVIQNPLRWRPADVSPWPAAPAIHLATVSRLEREKGIQNLIQALADCGASLPPWQLNIHGLGSCETELRNLVARTGLTSRVHFRGYVPDLRAVWAANHLMVSPAIDDGVPMTIPEAMLCQRPVLATCVGGAEDWLRDGETGFLCRQSEPGQLAAALRRALAEYPRWETMGHAAAAAAAARYRPDDYLKLLAPPAAS